METTQKVNQSRDKIIRFAIGFIGIGLLMLFFNYTTGGVFTSPRNITTLMKQGSVLMIVASGILLILAGRNNDLSGGMAVYFTSVFFSMMLVNMKMNPLLALVLTLVVSLMLGMINGVIVGILGIPAFIATLATSMIFKGTGYAWTNAATIGPVPSTVTFLSEGYIPPVWSLVGLFIVGLFITSIIIKKNGKLEQAESQVKLNIIKVIGTWITLAVLSYVFYQYKGIPMSVVLATLVILLTSILVNRTRFGREVFLLGGNMDAANLAGIKTDWRVFQSYIYMGFIYFVSGVVLTARLSGSTATSGNLIELDAIAAASIGGVSMAGGVGSIPGVIVGVIVLASIDNVMSLMDVSSYLQMVVKGVILLASVTFDIVRRKRNAA